jgi:predicted DNA-binding protein (MmcQ/YjbR family)
MAAMATKKGDSKLAQMRKICLALPETKETLTWGQPHFRVGDKIFSGYGEEKGKLTIGFKLEMDHADALISDPRFSRAPYVGHKGWVSMDASKVTDWEEVRLLIHESYRLIAPKRLVAALEPAAKAVAKPRATPKKPAKRAKMSGVARRHAAPKR